MKIAFWSEQKEVGTSFNLAMIACAAVWLHPLSVAVVSGGYHDDKLERKFFEKGRKAFGVPEEVEQFGREGILAAETQEFFLTSGLECLLRKECPQDLTERLVKANMRQIVKDRMYCLPASMRKEHEWWYQDYQFRRMERVMDAVDSYFDAVFIDCSSRQDDYAKKVFREADVCVLNMDQEAEAIGEFYSNRPDYKGKVFFLLGKYFGDALYTRKNLQRVYRVEEDRLGAIPFNPQLHAADQMGRIESGVRRYVNGDGAEVESEFGKELARTTNLLLRLAGLVA